VRSIRSRRGLCLSVKGGVIDRPGRLAAVPGEAPQVRRGVLLGRRSLAGNRQVPCLRALEFGAGEDAHPFEGR
jgi:hypothetical protein